MNEVVETPRSASCPSQGCRQENGITKFDPTNWFLAAIVLFSVACGFPVFGTLTPEGDLDTPCRGFEALILGWIGVAAGCPAWLANPLMLVAAFVCQTRSSAAFRMANCAVACALSTLLFWKPYPTRWFQECENVLCIGAVFWFAAIACAWRGVFVCWRTTNSGERVRSSVTS